VIGHPLVGWLVFTAVMWGTHFSPLFDAALENAPLHDLEHLLYLVSSMLFWWPMVGRDPSPFRMSHPARLLFMLIQMPFNSFLGVAILFSGTVLYPHYATTGRLWGPTPLEDQQAAGAIMWGLGDAGFLVAMLLATAAWMRHDEAVTRRREAAEDARAAAEGAASAEGGVAAEGAAAAGRGMEAGAAAADDGGAGADHMTARAGADGATDAAAPVAVAVESAVPPETVPVRFA
jgi:putative copper resistance protein D